ncbi:MAG TPA: heavy-metal-associated domain-containing protein [Candidatus Sulfotelmatobacter sp.]
MRVSLKSVAGVDSVDVSLEKGLAVVKMKSGNTATLKQLNEAVAKNGFTMKDSTATIAGTVLITDGKATLRVSGSDELLQLVPQSASVPGAVSMVGRTVVVEGTIPEGMKGKTPGSIRYQLMTEEKSQ